MTDILPFLKSLLSVSGLSGFEGPAARLIEEKWHPLVDEIQVSRVGSLHGLKKGSGKEPRPSIMIAAHMDAIGLMVSQIQDGFLHVTNLGGVDIRVLPGLEVIVHASGSVEELPGVIAMPPSQLLPEKEGDGVIALKHLLVDTGLTPQQVEKKVQVGDLVSFANEPLVLAGDVLSGHSVDNRASVAALTVCLEELHRVQHAWDVYAVATVQEEETLMGGFTSPFEIRPQIAVAVDVTHAKGPGASDWRTVPLGKGCTLDWGPNTHPVLYEAFRSLAERLDMPYQPSVYPSGSGTDAMGMQIVAEGIPTMVVSIPLRYMHTPVELVSYKDITRAGHLLAQFIAGLELDFVEKLKYED